MQRRSLLPYATQASWCPHSNSTNLVTSFVTRDPLVTRLCTYVLSTSPSMALLHGHGTCTHLVHTLNGRSRAHLGRSRTHLVRMSVAKLRHTGWTLVHICACVHIVRVPHTLACLTHSGLYTHVRTCVHMRACLTHLPACSTHMRACLTHSGLYTRSTCASHTLRPVHTCLTHSGLYTRTYTCTHACL